MSCMADAHEVQEANDKSKFHRQIKTITGDNVGLLVITTVSSHSGVCRGTAPAEIEYGAFES